MSDPQEPRKQEAILLTPVLNMGKLRLPANPPPFPPEFYHLIGIIGLTWGMYEVLFDRLLSALLSALGDVGQPGWQFTQYKKRRELCRQKIAALFTERTAIKRYLTSVIDDSGFIQVKRNAILHGKIDCKLVTTSPPQVFLVTTLRQKGKDITMTFSPDDLETLGYDIMHLSGRLNLTFENPVPGLSYDDIHSLRDLMSNHQTPPILPKLPAQPGSSPR